MTFRTRVVTIGAVTLTAASFAVAGALSAGTPAANAEASPAAGLLHGRGEGSCVQIGEPVATGPVTTAPCDWTDRQRWTENPVTTAAWAAYQLVNAASNTCLDSNYAGDVYQLPCQPGNDWQTWERQEGQLLPEHGGGTVTRYVNYKTRRCLVVEGGRATTLDSTQCNATAAKLHFYRWS